MCGTSLDARRARRTSNSPRRFRSAASTRSRWTARATRWIAIAAVSFSPMPRFISTVFFRCSARFDAARRAMTRLLEARGFNDLRGTYDSGGYRVFVNSQLF